MVSLAPSATRIIYELGAQNSLKGCTSYCSTAPEDSIEVVSDILTPNIEKIISLKPNLVVATAMLGAQHIRSLEKFGIKVLMLPYPQSVDEAFEQYLEIASQIARYHHEKWNGKGYPDGLKRKEIPLCARIMAIADVFDAVSENRCYRAALQLDTCFEIIQDGSGQDFDPILAEVFLDLRQEVQKVKAGTIQ